MNLKKQRENYSKENLNFIYEGNNFAREMGHRMMNISTTRSDSISTIASYHFVIDPNGNRTQVIQTEPVVAATPGAGTTNYGYNAQLNRLLTAGPYSFTYDNEGQLATGYGLTYDFDYDHRFTTITGTTQYSYDGMDNRLQAVRNGVTTRYVYDARGNLLAETDGMNNITMYYIHGLGLMAAVTPTGEAYNYHFSGVGSTVAMTNQFQDVVNKYAYDAFGNITNQVETVQQPFKFVGQFGVMTEPHGLNYMRARYYDPQVGRFISEDPVGFAGGDVNLCAYAGNSPVNFIDPSGLDRVTAILSTISASAGTVAMLVPAATVQAKAVAAGASGLAIIYTAVQQARGEMSPQEAIESYTVAGLDIASNVLGIKGQEVAEALVNMVSRPLGVTSAIKDVATSGKCGGR